MSAFKIWDYIYLTFPFRRGFLVVLAAIGFVPLSLIHMLPASARLTYAYVVASIAVLALYFTLGKFSQIAVDTIGTVILNRKSMNLEEHNPAWTEAALQVGIKKPVKFYISLNSKLNSAVTNPLTRKIYFPESWKKFSNSEQLGVIGHELDHIKNFRKFIGCLALVAVGVSVLAVPLGYVTAQVFVSISAISMELLLVSYFARRNELHADHESGSRFGPEGLISVFEIMLQNGHHDSDSETHPRLTKRISKLYELLDEQ